MAPARTHATAIALLHSYMFTFLFLMDDQSRTYTQLCARQLLWSSRTTRALRVHTPYKYKSVNDVSRHSPFFFFFLFFAARLYQAVAPDVVKRLGMRHVKGMLLYGPPAGAPYPFNHKYALPRVHPRMEYERHACNSHWCTPAIGVQPQRVAACSTSPSYCLCALTVKSFES